MSYGNQFKALKTEISGKWDSMVHLHQGKQHSLK